MDFIINDAGLPCTAAGIGGVFVEEKLTVVSVCQDPDNLSIIYIKALIQGVYTYTPTLTIEWGSKFQVFDSKYIPNWKGESVESFPINTLCSSKTVTLAYDIGSSIDDFASLKEFNIKLTFIGSSDEILSNPVMSDTFKSSNPGFEHLFIKGMSPVPYKLYYDDVTGKLKIQYLGMGDTPCLCSINCVSPTSDDFNLTTCNDEIQEISVNSNSIVGDPSLATITFIDPIGNTTVIGINAMLNVEPIKMTVLKSEDPLRNNITFSYVSINNTTISSAGLSYQILRYVSNPDNLSILKDWSSDSTDSFIDQDILPGKTYGYRVRFKGEFGDVSKSSQWATVVA
jgi:hypothetical protein